MKPSQLKALIQSRIKEGIKRPIHIEGSPGIGKTQLVAQVAKELGIGFRLIHAPLLQPEDYGFPVVNQAKDDVNFLVSKNKFPIEGSGAESQGILMIDELNQCEVPQQKILTHLIQERDIHGKRLIDGWVIVSTGNRTKDRAGANRLLSHLKNRVTTIELDPNLEDWTKWALENQVNIEVISFIGFRPELLNSFDPQREVNATPRSWVEGVSTSLGKVHPSVELEVFSGDVGEGAAAEFCAYLKIYRELPNLDAIILNPEKAEAPKDLAVRYALTTGLVYKTTGVNFERVLSFVKKMGPEFTILYVKSASLRKPEITSTKAFVEFVTEFQSLFN